MQILLSLKINENEKITLSISSFDQKFNYYRVPSKKLDKFDEVSLICEFKEGEMLIVKDILDDILFGLQFDLEKAVYDRLPIIPDSIEKGEMGKACIINQYRMDTEEKTYVENKTIDFSDYVFISGVDIQSWIYRDYYNNIYIEVSPLYPFSYRDIKEGEKFISFDDFMKNYKPYFSCVDKKNIFEWKQAVDLLYMEIDDECILH